MLNDMPDRFAETVDNMRPHFDPPAPAAIGDECECLSCLSDMKGIYPCLPDDEI